MVAETSRGVMAFRASRFHPSLSSDRSLADRPALGALDQFLVQRFHETDRITQSRRMGKRSATHHLALIVYAINRCSNDMIGVVSWKRCTRPGNRPGRRRQTAARCRRPAPASPGSRARSATPTARLSPPSVPVTSEAVGEPHPASTVHCHSGPGPAGQF